MSAVSGLLDVGDRVTNHRPWPRAIVTASVWQTATQLLADGGLTLLGLWGEPNAVHMALFDAGERDAGVISLDCPDGHYPSVGAHHAPAIRLERAIRSGSIRKGWRMSGPGWIMGNGARCRAPRPTTHS